MPCSPYLLIVGFILFQINEQLVFGPYAKEREISVSIVDDNQWEPDEEFFLRLSIVDEGFEKRDVVLGRLPIMEIVILNDDNPGKERLNHVWGRVRSIILSHFTLCEEKMNCLCRCRHMKFYKA